MNSSNTLLAALQGSITTAQAATQAAIADATAQSLANPLPVAGTTPVAAATALINQSDAMTQLYQLYQLSNVLGRMSVNTDNAGT